ncbi:hypothetical protein Mgra_00001663 [Meloidogyne graminicola]|uniref:DUF7802 domain-containing protein n=1 Tax=Meloidogyne graminicola TaxID=189291 RepID=A0A8S9ZYK3_9BILA|nr:hypothetical protein Mgra_00001663 [Meloidogyne graminicola]
MDYLLNRYVFDYLPFQISDELKKSISSSSMSVIKIADWFCKTQDLHNFIENHFTFFAVEVLYIFLFIFTLVHAFRLGGRYIYTWLGIFMLIILKEIVRFFEPAFDLQWHAQGILSFCGGRISISQIFGTQQVFIYVSYVFAERMHLRRLGQSYAIAIGALILKLPFDFIGTHFLWWTWDSNNPLTQEKIYGVPWIILAFDAFSIIEFNSALTFTRKYIVKDSYNWKL